MKIKITVLTLIIVSAVFMMNGCIFLSTSQSSEKEENMRTASGMLTYLRLAKSINEASPSFAFYIVNGVTQGYYTFEELGITKQEREQFIALARLHYDDSVSILYDNSVPILKK